MSSPPTTSSVGQLHDAAVHLVNAAGKEIAGGRTHTDTKANLRTYDLTPGTYSVVASSPVRLPEATRKTVTVQVTAGGTIVETVDSAQ